MSRLIGVIATCALLACRDRSAVSDTPATPASSPAHAVSAQPERPLAPALRAVLAEQDRALGVRSAVERRELDALYGPGEAIWLDAAGRPTASARDALALIDTAAAHGLDADDYRAARLVDEVSTLVAPETPDDARARFDVGLSLHVLRYWRDLHMGRVDPRQLEYRLRAPVDDHDFPAMLRAAIAAGRLGAATDELVPPLVLYRRLVTALGRYRELAAAEQPLAVSAPVKSWKPGASVDGLASLHARLVLLGDLPAGTPPPASSVYEGAIVEGVKRFQSRHGLDPDGALGRATLAALRVPLAARVQQIEWSLERLRWLPHLADEGFLAVNIPMFRLWSWGRMPPDGAPTFDMGVIVGRALDTETPVLVEEMRHVIFRPYWNIPPSILRGEILPAIAKDPRYLEKQDMEIVAGPGDDARAVPLSDEALARLRAGGLRVRQRPGPKNALGFVKFVFPNDDNIYMHGTPAPYLFGRARRDFSHGCVRVQDPVKLAEWVLRDQPEWTRERILAAMQAEAPQLVPITRPIQVVLYYLTAIVLPEGGTVVFADDIYGHDRKLARALED